MKEATHVSECGKVFYKDITTTSHRFTVKGVNGEWYLGAGEPPLPHHPIEKNPINYFISDQWFDSISKRHPIIKISMTDIMYEHLKDEAFSNVTLTSDEARKSYAGMKIHYLIGDQPLIKLETEVCETEYHFNDGVFTEVFRPYLPKKTMHDLMTDLETLDNGPQSVILSIGAVFFDPETGELGEKFYSTIDLESSINCGSVSASTIKFWMNQSDSAKKASFTGGDDLSKVLNDFEHFIREHSSVDKVELWGNGATFDNVILAHAYDQLGIDTPWKHWNNRDVRTVVKLGRDLLNINPKKDIKFEGVQHNALDDAIHQVKYVSEIIKGLNHGSSN